jgi:hypothetical protein
MSHDRTLRRPIAALAVGACLLVAGVAPALAHGAPVRATFDGSTRHRFDLLLANVEGTELAQVETEIDALENVDTQDQAVSSGDAQASETPDPSETPDASETPHPTDTPEASSNDNGDQQSVDNGDSGDSSGGSTDQSGSDTGSGD